MLGFDAFSYVFLLLILLGVLPNLFYTFGYLSHIQRKAYFLINYFAFIFAMIGVVVTDKILSFLFFWELMSLTSWQLILTEPNKESLKAARFYFFMTHFGFVFILVFFLLLSHNNLMASFDSLDDSIASFKYPTFLFFLLIFGFLSKAGVVPLHVWLPYAHPAAPSSVSALMSGVMLKVAIYAFLRFLFLIPHWELEWGIIILFLGSISSLVGVLYALSEHDIKALLANHSVENIGIILIAIGLGMIFHTLKLDTLSAFSFIAAIYHTFNHMSFKSLLFMGAGSILYQTHTKNMEQYGGLIKTMPITAFTFLLAAISISAMPPTNGFLSEWMIFQSMLSSASISDIALKLSFGFTIFALALTSGLAIACFVKAFGITFLGLARSQNAKHAKEVNILMLVGEILMALIVIGLMAFMPSIVKLINLALPLPYIYHKIFPNYLIMHSLANNYGAVAPLILLGTLLLITLSFVLIYKLLHPKIRLYHTWACGYNTNASMQYSTTGFAGPIRRFFAWLYKPMVHTHKETVFGHKTKFKKSLYEVHVKPLFEESLYEGVKKLLYKLSYLVYKISHFEKGRYSALIFNLLIFILFSIRVFYHQITWGSVVLEITIVAIFIAIILFGERK